MSQASTLCCFRVVKSVTALVTPTTDNSSGMTRERKFIMISTQLTIETALVSKMFTLVLR